MQLERVVKRRILYPDGKRRWTPVKVYPPVWKLGDIMPEMGKRPRRKKTKRQFDATVLKSSSVGPLQER